MLKVENGVIYINNKIFGTPKSSGFIYRGTNKVGRIDKSGKVYDKKDREIGEVDANQFKFKTSKIVKSAAVVAKKTTKSSKTATRKKVKEKETKSESTTSGNKSARQVLGEVAKSDVYIPGKDSYLIVTGRLGKIAWPQKYEKDNSKEFVTLNQSRGWNYLNWSQLCSKEDLDEKTLEKYKKYIDWYTFIKFHPTKVFTEEFKKKNEKYIKVD